LEGYRYVALISAFNSLVFVQARIGMLDTFMMACKWFALMPLIGVIGLVMLVRLFQVWRLKSVDCLGNARSCQRPSDAGDS